ncbi:MAG: DUF4160 domain-containing protein [Bacteroidia bacterium]|nr:DUF4160 domain-containing protein [Bacteroidia bacterium]
MPKIYKYLGIYILFHSREHKPIHIHGKHGEYETKAEFIIVNGQIVDIKYKTVKGKKNLKKAQFKDFKIFIEHYKEQILQKWIDYFVLNKTVELEEINYKLE